MINGNESLNDYITTLIGINKNLRDQLEVLYKLLSKKLIIEISKDNKSLSRPMVLLNELETLKSNLSIQMENQNDFVESLSKIEANQACLKQDINSHLNTIQLLNNQLEEITNENIVLKNKVINIQKDNEKLENAISEGKKDKEKLIESNGQLAKDNAKLKEERGSLQNDILINEANNQEFINEIDSLTKKIKDMEKKYKSKLEQKDMIIAKLDERLQEYEEKLQAIPKQDLYSNQIEQEEPEEIDDDDNHGNTNDNEEEDN